MTGFFYGIYFFAPLVLALGVFFARPGKFRSAVLPIGGAVFLLFTGALFPVLAGSKGIIVFAPEKALAQAGVTFAADYLAAGALLLVQIYLLKGVVVFARSEIAKKISSAFFSMVFLLYFAVNAFFLTADIFSLYLCLELIFLIVVCGFLILDRDRNILSAARVMPRVFFSSSLLLLAVAVTYAYVSTLNLAMIARNLDLREAGLFRSPEIFILMFFILGVGLKCRIPGLIANLRPDKKISRKEIPLKVVFAVVLGYFILRVFFYAFSPVTLPNPEKAWSRTMRNVMGSDVYEQRILEALR